MATINIELLKKILENVPDDFDVEFTDGKKNYQIANKIEVDVGAKKLILRKF